MNFADKMRWLLLWETLLVTGCLGLGLMLLVPAWRDAITFFFLAIPSSAFLLIPHEPILLVYAEILPPLTIALLSGSGAALAAAVDYQAFHTFWQFSGPRRIQATRSFRWAVRWFSARPFLTTWLFFLLPLPDHVIRFLAPASRFSRRGYVAAVGLGRAPRGYALALLQREIHFPPWALVAIGVGVIVLGAWPFLQARMRRAPAV